LSSLGIKKTHDCVLFVERRKQGFSIVNMVSWQAKSRYTVRLDLELPIKRDRAQLVK